MSSLVEMSLLVSLDQTQHVPLKHTQYKLMQTEIVQI